METLKNKFKKTSLYFWFVLVLFPALRDAFLASETRGRVMDIVITLIVASITVYFLNLKSNNDVDCFTFLLILGTAIVLRFLSNLFYIPAKLYFDTFRKQDRLLWDSITVEKRRYKDGRKLLGYGICIKNAKPFQYGVLVKLTYFEVDGIPYQDDPEALKYGKGMRLVWMENHNPLAANIGILEADNGENNFKLLDIARDKKIYHLSYWVKSKTEDKMLFAMTQIGFGAKGEIEIQLNNQDRSTSQKYNFEILVSRYGDPTMKFNKGGFSSYRSSIADVINNPLGYPESSTKRNNND